jgi:hypothetical protein
VSRWNVPYKIMRAKIAGTFDESVKDCPPIDPDWLRLVPAALEEHRRYISQFSDLSKDFEETSKEYARRILRKKSSAVKLVSSMEASKNSISAPPRAQPSATSKRRRTGS